MTQPALGLIVAVLAWWASTGVVLWLVRRPERAFTPMLAGGGVVALVALYGMAVAARDPGVGGALLGFGSALLVWGWHELAFLTGRLAGSEQAVAPAHGWARFRAAAGAVMHHEIALALTAMVVLAVTWGGANPTGLLTFLVLFGMRLSTKLNIFLGVANPPLAFLPRTLEHLRVWFRKRRFNALFPLSLAACAAATWALGAQAVDPATAEGLAFGFALTAGLSALGLIEHAFLMTPAPDRALWGWALGRQGTGRSKP